MHAHEARLHAGVATVDITPSEPVVMGGYGGRDDPFSGVRDPLYATALVLDDGASCAALVSVDLLNVSRELSARVRRRVAEADLGVAEVVIAATHTHAGPYMPARALDVSPALQADQDVSAAVEEIRAGIVQAITTAATDLAPAEIEVGRTEIRNVAQNRRAAGGVGGTVRLPQGPIDPELIAADIQLGNGSELVLYHFACHPVCTTGANTELSADWPGVVRTWINRERPDAHVLYLNGAAGDINPGATKGVQRGADTEAFLQAVGSRIGAAVLTAIDADTETGTTRLHRPSLRTKTTEPRFALRNTPAPQRLRQQIDELAAELETLRESGDTRGARDVRFRLQEAKEVLAIAEWDATSLPSRLTYLELGELGVLGMPGEVLVEHGLRLKAAADPSYMMPISYADDYIGYLPTLDDLPRGGYEVRTMKVAPNALVEFRQAANALITDARGSRDS